MILRNLKNSLKISDNNAMFQNLAPLYSTMGLYYDKILLFGDSITELSCSKDLDFGFHPALQGTYIRKLDVINRGFYGYNTAYGVRVLPEILRAEHTSKSKIRLMSLYLGSNDALKGSQYLGIDDYRKNMVRLIQMALEEDIKVIVIAPSFYDRKRYKITAQSEGFEWSEDIGSNRRNHSYSQTAETVARQLGVPFVNLWEAFKKFGNWTDSELYDENIDFSSLLSDGVHFTATAYRIMFEMVMKAILENFPDLDPEKIPQKLACYSDIDPGNIEGSIFVKN